MTFAAVVCTTVLAPAAAADVAVVAGIVAFVAVAAFDFAVRIGTVLPHQAVK